MGDKTLIEWTDSTWSPIRFRVKQDATIIARAKGYTSLVQIAEKMAGRVGSHCEHASNECQNCYAESNNHRCLPANGTGLPYDRRSRDLVEPFIDEKALLRPIKWTPRRIFVENQSDLFGEWVTDEMLDRVFAVMAQARHNVYQVLTKRPERMLAYMSAANLSQRLHEAVKRMMGYDHPDRRAVNPTDLPLANVWAGVSVGNQKAADERIPLLLQTPAAVRFLSCEPLLGPVDLKPSWINPTRQNDNPISWVIAGSESGHGARPMDEQWVRSLRNQCAAAGVAFFYKQKLVGARKIATPALDGIQYVEFPR